MATKSPDAPDFGAQSPGSTKTPGDDADSEGEEEPTKDLAEESGVGLLPTPKPVKGPEAKGHGHHHHNRRRRVSSVNRGGKKKARRRSSCAHERRNARRRSSTTMLLRKKQRRHQRKKANAPRAFHDKFALIRFLDGDGVDMDDAMNWLKESRGVDEYGEIKWNSKEKSWSQNLVFDSNVDAPPPPARERSRKVCQFKGEDDVGNRYVCNNDCTRNKVTKQLEYFCGWHVSHCIHKHLPGRECKIKQPNRHGMCISHHLAIRNKRPPELDKLEVPGVIMVFEKLVSSSDSYDTEDSGEDFGEDDFDEDGEILDGNMADADPEGLGSPTGSMNRGLSRALSRVQSLSPRSQSPRRQRMARKATALQQRKRGFFGKIVFSVKKYWLGKKARMIMQRCVRGWRARRAAAKLKIVLESERRLRVAVLLNTHIRGYLARRRVRLMKSHKMAAVFVIQDQMKRYKIRMNRWKRQSATAIQRTLRGFFGRELVRVMRYRILNMEQHDIEQYSALVIQRTVRTWFHRRWFQRTIQEVRRREKAVRVLQRCFRSWRRVRKFWKYFYAMREAAIRVQNRYRARFAMRRVLRLRRRMVKAAGMIERVFRGSRARKLAAAERVKIEQAYRWLRPSNHDRTGMAEWGSGLRHRKQQEKTARKLLAMGIAYPKIQASLRAHQNLRDAVHAQDSKRIRESLREAKKYGVVSDDLGRAQELASRLERFQHLLKREQYLEVPHTMAKLSTADYEEQRKRGTANLEDLLLATRTPMPIPPEKVATQAAKGEGGGGGEGGLKKREHEALHQHNFLTKNEAKRLVRDVALWSGPSSNYSFFTGQLDKNGKQTKRVMEPLPQPLFRSHKSSKQPTAVPCSPKRKAHEKGGQQRWQRQRTLPGQGVVTQKTPQSAVRLEPMKNNAEKFNVTSPGSPLSVVSSATTETEYCTSSRGRAASRNGVRRIAIRSAPARRRPPGPDLSLRPPYVGMQRGDRDLLPGNTGKATSPFGRMRQCLRDAKDSSSLKIRELVTMQRKQQQKGFGEASDTFGSNVPIPIVSRGVFTETNNASREYVRLLRLWANPEVINDDGRFTKIVCHAFVFVDRHWQRLLNDLYAGTLHPDLPISEAARHRYLYTAMPQAALAVQAEKHLKLLGFHQRLLFAESGYNVAVLQAKTRELPLILSHVPPPNIPRSGSPKFKQENEDSFRDSNGRHSPFSQGSSRASSGSSSSTTSSHRSGRGRISKPGGLPPGTGNSDGPIGMGTPGRSSPSPSRSSSPSPSRSGSPSSRQGSKQGSRKGNRQGRRGRPRGKLDTSAGSPGKASGNSPPGVTLGSLRLLSVKKQHAGTQNNAARTPQSVTSMASSVHSRWNGSQLSCAKSFRSKKHVPILAVQPTDADKHLQHLWPKKAPWTLQAGDADRYLGPLRIK